MGGNFWKETEEEAHRMAQEIFTLRTRLAETKDAKEREFIANQIEWLKAARQDLVIMLKEPF